MATIAGFGRDTYGSGTWGEPVPVSVTGVSATSAVGTVVVVPSIEVVPAGVAGTGSIGTVTVDGSQTPDWSEIAA